MKFGLDHWTMGENHISMTSRVLPRNQELLCCLILASWELCSAQPPQLPQPSSSGVPINATTPPGQSAIMNQPVVVNTFESVERERLRLAEEVAKLERDDAEFREQVTKLQAKLAGLSLVGMTPSSMPSDYRAFISANAGEIEKSDAYYALLKTLLNELTPESPYRARKREDNSNPLKASQRLATLSEYAEDDDICRTIRGHIASLSGGRVDDARRQFEIGKTLTRLAGERRRLEWNLRMANGFNPLSGQPRSTEDERAYIRNQIADVAKEVKSLEDEKESISHLVTAAVRKLQFQQFIIELAMQQRYIHSLIACGFYRNSFKRGDLSISEEAYPNGHSSKSQKTAASNNDSQPSDGKSPQNPVLAETTTAPALPTGAPASSLPSAELPVISTITGLESFLLNRIRDAIKDREAMDNMLREGQMSAAESVLRKMMLTAKYQPELQTLPYADRQKIQRFSQTAKRLSDALNARDYPEISRLAGEVEKDCSDAGMSDLKVFAAEHPRKAMHWAKQSELALKAGDPKTAQSLMEAAIRRAPLNPDVTSKIEGVQDDVLNDNRLADDIQDIVQHRDYQTAFERMNEFVPLVASENDPGLKTKYEALLEMERSLRAALEKCDELERRGNYSEAWLALSTLDATVANDSRLNLRKSKLSGKCARFVSNYTNAVEHEQSGKNAISLAWYLSALSDAPGSEQLQAKAIELGNRLLKN